MQTQFKSLFLLSISALLLFSSCSHKTNKEGRYIPEDASFVLMINGQSLSSKLPWEEIKQNEFFKQMHGDSAASGHMKMMMENPENSGIDIKSDIIFFMVKGSVEGSYIVVEGNIKDEAKFRQFNKDMHKNLAVESDKGNLHFSEVPEMTTAWNKEKFVVLVDADKKGRYRLNESETNKARMAFAENIFNLSEDKSLGDDEKFSGLVSSTGDIHFWLNMELIAADKSMMPDMGPTEMLNMKKVYEDSRVTGTASFDNGKINADLKTYMGKDMTDLIKKYGGDKINADMLKRIPAKDLAGLVALNFKPEGIKEFLKLIGADGFANMGASNLGFNLDDFIKANKGDILLAVTDVKIDSSGETKPTGFFAASIDDKTSFNKLIEAGKKMQNVRMKGMSLSSLFYNKNDNYFAIGTDQQLVDAYINTAANNSFAFMDKISGSSGAAYINFQFIIKSLGAQMPKDSAFIAIRDLSLKTWDDMIAYNTGFKDGGSTQHIEVNFIDKSTNSLKQLSNYFTNIGLIFKRQEEKYMNMFNDKKINIDSLMREVEKLQKQH